MLSPQVFCMYLFVFESRVGVVVGITRAYAPAPEYDVCFSFASRVSGNSGAPLQVNYIISR